MKSVHSLAFLGIAASVVHIFWAGVANRRSRLTGPAIAVAVGESAIFAGNGFRCPLRQLAEGLGAESGQVTDIFLPRWLANRIPWIFTPLLAVGLAGLLWHGCRDDDGTTGELADEDGGQRSPWRTSKGPTRVSARSSRERFA